MPCYTFGTLSPYDFECLSRDLLQEELGLTLETFTAGPDDGIDLRHSRDPARMLIVQCKHWVGTGFSGLHSHLVKKELPKIRALNPARYVLTTSAPLTPANKQTLVDDLEGHVKSPQDIHGPDDLNNLLGLFPHVERRHFKLYLESEAVLSRVLHNDLYIRASALLDSITRKARIYVPNASYAEAQQRLEANNICIIAGVPGVGKTTLAEMLMLDLHRRNYEIIEITSDIAEADRVYNVERPQAFYYDDFLGQVASADKLGKNEDDRLVKFMLRVRAAKNKRLILTTREYILEQAKLRYEKLDRHRIDLHKYIIDLEKYSTFDRALLLYNHVHFSAIPPSWKLALLRERAYMRIINHANFNPRLIEDVIRLASESARDGVGFVAFMEGVLSNPVTLWEHPFERHLSPLAQQIVLTVASMPPETALDDLRDAIVSSAWFQEGRHSLRDFEDAIRVLSRTFIDVGLCNPKQGDRFQVAKLHNPSIRDFLLGYLDRFPDQVRRLVEDAAYHEQCSRLWLYAVRGLREWGRAWTDPVRYAGIRRALANAREAFYAALRRTFWARCVDIETINWAGGPTEKRKKDEASAEDRFILVAEVVRELGLEEDAVWTRATVDQLCQRWAQGSGDKGEIGSVLSYVGESPLWTLDQRRAIVDVARKWLLGSLRSTEDFQALVRLQEESEGFFGEADVAAAHHSYEVWRRSEEEYVLEHADDSSAVEDTVSDIRVVAEFFGESPDGYFLDRAEERASFLALSHEERAKPPDSPIAHPRGEGLKDMAAIDVMFQVLREEG